MIDKDFRTLSPHRHTDAIYGYHPNNYFPCTRCFSGFGVTGLTDHEGLATSNSSWVKYEDHLKSNPGPPNPAGSVGITGMIHKSS